MIEGAGLCKAILNNPSVIDMTTIMEIWVNNKKTPDRRFFGGISYLRDWHFINFVNCEWKIIIPVNCE